MGPQSPSDLFGGMMTFSVIIGVGTFAIYIIGVVAAWKFMKAHESIASTLKRAVDIYETKEKTGNSDL